MIRWLSRLVLMGAVAFVLTAGAMLWQTAKMQRDHGGGRAVDAVDAAIVLGGGADPDGVLRFATRQRVGTGVALLAEGKADLLVMTGGLLRGRQITAAAAMRNHAIATGADPAQVLTEDRARTTFENLRFSFEILDARGAETYALVTDDYHLTRGAALATALGRAPDALAAADSFRHEHIALKGAITVRETLAWWYNLYKVTAWAVLGWLGVDDAARGEMVF